MMKNKLAYTLYAIALLTVILSAYKFYGSSQRDITKKSIEHLDMTTIKMYQKQFDTNRTFGYLWGIKDIKKAKDVNKSKSLHSDSNATLHVTQENNQICIAENCYRFLGIYYKKDTPFISFYSKVFKKRLKDFKLYDTLDKSIYIQEIKHNQLFLADKNTSKIWKFQLFDVNATQYKPKDINETDI